MVTKDLKASDLKEPPKWAAIRQMMQKDFVNMVTNLNTSEIPVKIKDHVLKNYIKTDAWKIADITKASSAAGALALWA